MTSLTQKSDTMKLKTQNLIIEITTTVAITAAFVYGFFFTGV